MMLKTTLALLHKANACSAGLQTLTASLGSKWTDDKEISLKRILKSNGLDHAIWAMRATTEPCKRAIVLLSVDFAMEVLGNFEKAFPDDKRPREALQAASDFMDGKITLAQLEDKKSAARSAARSAAYSAAYSAADSAADSAYWAADSANSAVDSVDSVDSAVDSAAYSARLAARSAARSAADSAADSAYWAAYSAAIERQKALFLKRVSK